MPRSRPGEIKRTCVRTTLRTDHLKLEARTAASAPVATEVIPAQIGHVPERDTHPHSTRPVRSASWNWRARSSSESGVGGVGDGEHDAPLAGDLLRKPDVAGGRRALVGIARRGHPHGDRDRGHPAADVTIASARGSASTKGGASAATMPPGEPFSWLGPFSSVAESAERRLRYKMRTLAVVLPSGVFVTTATAGLSSKLAFPHE